MKRKMLCGNEVSESHWKINNNSSSSSCKSIIDVDGTHDNIVMMNNASNKQRSRSYCGNRFYCKHSQTLMIFMLLVVCLHLPLFINATVNNTNETTILASMPSIPLEQISNQEVSNEIITNLEENQKLESADNIIESSLSETLEDKIRNDVKNQIEMVSNPGSPTLINVLNAMPETEKLVYVEYAKVPTSTLVSSTTPKLETKEASEEISDKPVETEENCDDSSFVCKNKKQELTSTTTSTNHIANSTATELDKTTTVEPIIDIEAITTIEPIEIESTINPMNNIPQEEEFEVIEDNMREAQNIEIKDELIETAIELESKINPNSDLSSLKGREKIAAVPLKDVLKSIVAINHAAENVKGDLEHKIPTNSTISKTQKIMPPTGDNNIVLDNELATGDSADGNNTVSANSTEKINSVSENITNENDKGESSSSDNLNTELSETSKSEANLTQQIDLKGEINGEFDIVKHQNKILTDSADNVQNNANELPVNVNELNELISEPLITQLASSTSKKEESSTSVDVLLEESPKNEKESSTRVEIEHIFFTPKPISEHATSEVNNHLITSASTVAELDNITPVVADHTDFFTNESPKVLSELPEKNVEAEIENQNDPLSIVLKEELTAAEPNILFENPQVKELLENVVINAAAQATTIQPEIPIHNVIKKQGVEPIIEDVSVLTTLIPTTSIPSTTIYNSPEIIAYQTDTTEVSSISEENITSEIENNQKNETEVIKTEPINTTNRAIENSVANDITEVAVVFPGKSDEDAISSGKGSRSINSLHNVVTEHNHKASIHVDAYPAGQTFNENLAEEMPNGIGKALLTHHQHEKSLNRSTLVIALSSCVTLLFIVISVTIFMVSFHRQHGTLDIEMQEQRCGKDNIDEENETHIKLLEIELPNTSLALQTDAEAEIEECL